MRQAPNRLYKRALAARGLHSRGGPPSLHCAGVVLFTVVRNEQLRLPYFLDYYSRLGVAGIVAVDHGSTDATPDILDEHPLVIRYETDQHFDMKESWLDLLLRRYGTGRWCLVVDADEILRYPRDDRVSLSDLCAHMDRAEATALQTVLLDMYPLRSLDECDYTSGADPLAACSFFDHGLYAPSRRWVPRDLSLSDELLDASIYGGVRTRLFDLPSICISKYPLFRFESGTFAGRGCHFVEGIRPSRIRGCLLHFKFLPDFPEKVATAVKERQYAGESADYRKYALALRRRGRIEFRGDVSTRLETTAQLVECGIMRETTDLYSFAAATGRTVQGNHALTRAAAH